MNDRPEAPGFDQLIDWLDGRLSADQAAVIAKRVAAGGPDLERRVAWLRAYLAAAERIQFKSSPTLRTRLAELLTDQTPRRPISTSIRRYIAELVTDSRARLDPAGLRGMDDVAAPRQLLFASDVIDIALNISATRGGTTLRGQVFPNIDEPADRMLIQLLQDSIEVHMTETDSMGQFVFVDLPSGVYDLIALGRSLEVQTTAISVDT